jgi:ubiquitin-protein ligase
MVDDRTNVAITVKNALTGDSLDVDDLDLTFPIVVVRHRVAESLGIGFDQVSLLDDMGNVFDDLAILGQLRFLDLCFSIASKEQMSPDTLPPPAPSKLIGPGRTHARLTNELTRFSLDSPQGFHAEAVGSDDDAIVCWRITFPGPEGTAFAGSTCELLMRFPHNYPYEPPEVWLVSEIGHWSVTAEGKVILDILGDSWSPAFTATSIVQGVSSVLAD